MPNLSTQDGTPTGGVYGFATLSLEVIKRLKPDYVAVAWDKPKTNIRKRLALYPEYKAGRKPAPADFYAQIPILHELLDSLGWPLYELDDYEADDIIAGLAKKADAEGDIETFIITSDMDALQCLSNHTKAYLLKKGLSNIEEFHPESFEKKYGLKTEQFLDLKALQGDTSDNIPGVPGIGIKTATELLQRYQTLDGIYENVELISGATHDKLVRGKKSAYLSKQVATLFIDAPIELDLQKMDVHNFDLQRLRENLKKLEFRAILRQLDTIEVPASIDEPAIDSNEQLLERKTMNTLTMVAPSSEFLEEAQEVYVYARSSLKQGKDPLFVVAGTQKGVTILTKEHHALIKILSQKPLIGYDLKKSLKTLMDLGGEDFVVGHDVQVAAFLLNSLDRALSLQEIAEHEHIVIEDVADVPNEDIGEYAIQYISGLIEMTKKQREAIEKLPKLAKLAEEIEWPIIPILAKMEKKGILLDSAYLEKMSVVLEDKISDLEQTIYGFAEEEFNISSPQQLAKILFETMKLPSKGIKKGKTGFSTAANELEKLRLLHPIIDCISAYREYTKLKSTYVDALPNQADEENRVHTSFNLTVAQTGRLSSTDPNLQNIPVRSELGKTIRTAFVADEGCVFVSADYSQFELRLAAVMAKDSDMIEVFNNGEDIHVRTASEIYGIALEDVTNEQRSAAKTINFGILYGMSPHGLAAATGMSYEEAKDFIDRYFSTRKPLVDYIESLREKAKVKGYVETLYGRIRPTPDVNAQNYIVREAALRQAVNMPIQGTEADIMKLAMKKVETLLPNDCYQLLQIHDSILVECPIDKKEAVEAILKDAMEQIAPNLGIKLLVDVHSGNNWGEL